MFAVYLKTAGYHFTTVWTISKQHCYTHATLQTIYSSVIKSMLSNRTMSLAALFYLSVQAIHITGPLLLWVFVGFLAHDHIIISWYKPPALTCLGVLLAPSSCLTQSLAFITVFTYLAKEFVIVNWHMSNRESVKSNPLKHDWRHRTCVARALILAFRISIYPLGFQTKAASRQPVRRLSPHYSHVCLQVWRQRPGASQTVQLWTKRSFAWQPPTACLLRYEQSTFVHRFSTITPKIWCTCANPAFSWRHSWSTFCLVHLLKENMVEWVNG